MLDKETDRQRHNADALRRLIDETLLQSSTEHITGFFTALHNTARQRGLEWQPAIVVEYWWGLARLGVIALSGQINWPLTAGIPLFLLTSRGRVLLERGENSPHNPERYYRFIEQQIKGHCQLIG
jgi:hypothetical protein